MVLVPGLRSFAVDGRLRCRHSLAMRVGKALQRRDPPLARYDHHHRHQARADRGAAAGESRYGQPGSVFWSGLSKNLGGRSDNALL